MKICLDAGHYKGYNQGVVKSYYEGNIMWKVTNLQKKYLEQNINTALEEYNVDVNVSKIFKKCQTTESVF